VGGWPFESFRFSIFAGQLPVRDVQRRAGEEGKLRERESGTFGRSANVQAEGAGAIGNAGGELRDTDKFQRRTFDGDL
jgi:hypothetical protein